VDDPGTIIIVFFFTDPLGLEGAETLDNEGTPVGSVLTLRWGGDSDFIAGGEKIFDLFLESIGQTFVQSATAGEDDVLGEFALDIHVTPIDG